MSAKHASNSQEIDISNTNAPLHIKFALVCLSKYIIPKWLGSFFFFLSHLQILAIIIKTTYLALPDNTPNASPIIKLFVKLFVVGDWLDYNSTPSVVIGVCIITFYTIKVVGLMVSLHICLYKKRKIPDFIQYYWSVVRSLHPLLFFFWIHTFCVNITEYPKKDEVANGIRVTLITLAYINTVINCVLAVFFSIILVIYKTKDVMSSKTNLLETKSLIFKIIIPILWRFVENDQRMQIFTLVLILLNAISHDWIFIHFLPYYRIRILLLSAVLQSSQTSLALISFIIKIIEVNQAKSNHIGVFSVQIIWLLTLPIFAKFYYCFTWKILLYIFGCQIKDEKNLAYLVHKRFILLYFLKSRKAIHEGINQFSFADIMYQARLAEIVEDSTASFEEFDTNKRLLVRSLKSICLEVLSRYPRALLAQISLANSFSNFEDLYLVSNNLLEDAISKRPGYQAQISLNLIRFELQKKLKIQFSEKSGEGLNVNSYIVNHELFEEMKKGIEQQAKMQLSFWKEFSSSTAKMLNLMHLAFKVNDQRIVVKKIWNNLLKIRPVSFLSPLTIYGMYSSLINNDPIEGEKYIEQFQEDAKRMSKICKEDELSNETIFSDKSVKVTMSGLRANLGKIIDCSANIGDFYGWQASDMKSRSIGSIMPPFFRQRHDAFLLNHFNTGKTRILNKTLVIPVKRSNGYIHPSWIHAKVSPFMYNGMSYVALLRPCKLTQRMVLVKKDGKIDDMCIQFAQDLNLTRDQDLDIFTLCPEFQKINEAYNVIAEGIIEMNTKEEHKNESYSPSKNFPSEGERFLQHGNQRNGTADPAENEMISIEKFNLKKGRMDKNKAQLLYDHFNAGSTLEFYPQNTPKESITYSVKILNSIHEKDVIKFVLLERISGHENEAQLSQEEDAFSSVKMMAQKLLENHNLQTETFPTSPKLLQTQSSPAAYETERAELMYLATSPRLKTDFKFSEPNNNETNFSVSDEVQDDEDFTARKIITRNICNFGGSPKKNQSEMKTIEDQMFQTIPTQSAFMLTEVNEGKPLNAAVKIRKKAQTHQTLGKRNQKVLQVLDQEEKLKFKKLKKKIVVDPAQIQTNCGGSSFDSKGKKVHQMVVRALKGEPKKRSTTILKYLSVTFISFMIILLVIQNQNLHSGINDVQSQIPVMSRGFWRVYELISSTTTVLVWMEALKLTFPRDWAFFNLEYRERLVWYAAMMKSLNAQFFQLLSKQPTEMQTKFYEKNVAMYEYEGENRTLIGTYSTFGGFQLISEKQYSCLNQEIPDHFVPGIDLTNWKFITDNALNDLLVQADNQNTRLLEDLDDSTSVTTLKIILTLGIVLTICLIFILISIRYLWVIASEVRIFMTVLFRIQPQKSETTLLMLQHFISALDRNGTMILGKINIIEDNPQGAIKFRKASMSSFYRTQRVVFMKFLPIYILFICWSIIYYFLTSDFLANIKDSQNRMEAALQALNDQGLFVHETFAILLANGTFIKNEPVMPAFLKSLENLKQTDRFVNKFRDRRGQLTALQEKILFNFPCEDFLPVLAQSSENYDRFIYAYWSCLNVESKRGSVGLVYLYSGFVNNGYNFLEQYERSNKTKEALKDLVVLVQTMNRDEINTAEGFLDLLYQATEDNFHEQVDSIKNTTLHFVIATIIVTLIAIWMTWFFVIKKILRMQKIDWLILQLVPMNLILGNKHIQQYLLKQSNGMLDGVKNYL